MHKPLTGIRALFQKLKLRLIGREKDWLEEDADMGIQREAYVMELLAELAAFESFINDHQTTGDKQKTLDSLGNFKSSLDAILRNTQSPNSNKEGLKGQIFEHRDGLCKAMTQYSDATKVSIAYIGREIKKIMEKALKVDIQGTMGTQAPAAVNLQSSSTNAAAMSGAILQPATVAVEPHNRQHPFFSGGAHTKIGSSGRIISKQVPSSQSASHQHHGQSQHAILHTNAQDKSFLKFQDSTESLASQRYHQPAAALGGSSNMAAPSRQPKHMGHSNIAAAAAPVRATPGEYGHGNPSHPTAHQQSAAPGSPLYLQPPVVVPASSTYHGTVDRGSFASGATEIVQGMNAFFPPHMGHQYTAPAAPYYGAQQTVGHSTTASTGPMRAAAHGYGSGNPSYPAHQQSAVPAIAFGREPTSPYRGPQQAMGHPTTASTGPMRAAAHGYGGGNRTYLAHQQISTAPNASLYHQAPASTPPATTYSQDQTVDRASFASGATTHVQEINAWQRSWQRSTARDFPESIGEEESL